MTSSMTKHQNFENQLALFASFFSRKERITERMASYNTKMFVLHYSLNVSANLKNYLSNLDNNFWVNSFSLWVVLLSPVLRCSASKLTTPVIMTLVICYYLYESFSAATSQKFVLKHYFCSEITIFWKILAIILLRAFYGGWVDLKLIKFFTKNDPTAFEFPPKVKFLEKLFFAKKRNFVRKTKTKNAKPKIGRDEKQAACVALISTFF